jgi:hypothetical protein
MHNFIKYNIIILFNYVLFLPFSIFYGRSFMKIKISNQTYIMIVRLYCDYMNYKLIEAILLSLLY